MKRGEIMYDVRYLNSGGGGYLNNSRPMWDGTGTNNGCNCIKSYFRIFHAVVDLPKVNVYINEMLLASNLNYGEFSKFIPLLPGNYKITVYAAGRTSPPILESYIAINRNTAYTGALSGKMPNTADVSLRMIPEVRELVPITRMSAMRFTNLSPDTPALDLVSGDGTILFSDVEFGETTDNVAVPPGVYTLYVKIAGSENTVLTVPEIEFERNMYYSLFTIGIYNGTPSVELLIPEDGLNYLDLC